MRRSHTARAPAAPALVKAVVLAMVLVAAACALLSACAGVRFREGPVSAAPASYPSTTFAVLSDIHVYDRSLGTTGAAFDQYLANDRKLLVQSEELLATALDRIRATDARFVVIPGDLTKDGEESSHRLVAERLAALERNGIRAYVVPGNHDVRNPHARRFDGAAGEPVKYVEPDEFAALYADFGYGDAVERDPRSLSYVAEPVPGLWLLAIDSCDTSGNIAAGGPFTGSRFTAERRAWITRVLARAVAERKAVIAVLHHGVVKHYASQDKYFRQYLAGDYDGLAHLLARAGVRVAFSGHYHAQDIAVRRWSDGSVIYDVETNSLVTWPCSYRLVTIDEAQTMRIASGRIDSLPSMRDRGEDFGAYARRFTTDGVDNVARRVMTTLGVPVAEASRLSGQVADAFLAHYAGDERFTGTEMLSLHGLSLMGRIVVGARKDLIYDLWSDSEPPDNALAISLDTGIWSALEGSP